MSAQPVGVLAAMDEDRARIGRAHGLIMSEWDGSLSQHDSARAAVAELIEASTPFAQFNGSEPTITVRTPDVARLRAALAAARPQP